MGQRACRCGRASGSKGDAGKAIEKQPKIVDLHLTARLLSGRTMECTLLSSATVWQFCSTIQAELDIPAHQQKLVVRGAVLRVPFNKSLEEAGVKNGDVFDVVNTLGPSKPEDISPRGLRQMLAEEIQDRSETEVRRMLGIGPEEIHDMNETEMIRVLERSGWHRTDEYVNKSNHDDIQGIPLEFCNAMRGKMAVECIIKSQFFGGHILRFFTPLAVPDALKFTNDQAGNFGLRSTAFILNLADGSMYVNVCPLRYQPAESDDVKALESYGLIEVRYPRYSPGLTRGDTWWLLPRDRPKDEGMELDRAQV